LLGLKRFHDAVAATGRKKLIMAGLTNDVCIVYRRSARSKVMAELATDWASAVGAAIQGVMYEESLKRLIEWTEQCPSSRQPCGSDTKWT
jgi:hypothetical protein